ncbi:hypothetical protein F2Q70_00023108 [Brassica cretica]|nr:hypothetical protein F2Q70_00023108 [Brassica cretica]KAF3604904.1 hypothetical protein DY000_02049301 [Brassica cretica]
MAVDEHDKLPEATQREDELQRQIDDLQGQVTGLQRDREETNPELSSEFQILKEKLNEHSKQLEQSAENVSQLESENLTSETRTKPLTQRATRSVDSGPRFALCHLWKHLTPRQARISQLRRREEKHLRGRKPRMLRPMTGRTATRRPSLIRKHQTEQRERSLPLSLTFTRCSPTGSTPCNPWWIDSQV